NEDLRHVNTGSDSEVLMNIFAHELLKRGKMYIEEKLRLNVDDVFHAVSKVHERCRGGYAIVTMITGYGVLGFRDPWGIRPLILGRRDAANGGDEWVLASESVALIALGCEIVRDVAPGEAVFITAGGQIYEKRCSDEVTYNPCIFEHVYFARPDSIIDGISVHRARLKMGKKLAARIPEEHSESTIDVVIPVPDSGRIAAMELAKDLDVPFREGFVKNRYVGRTFIMPGQAIRKDSVRKKLTPIPYEFDGKNVLLVDDSIVRGNTSAKIVKMARDAGAKKVFFASAAPPVIHPNVYGIDMPAKSEYIAHGRTQEEVSEAIGADWLMYQKIEDLLDACQGGSCGVEEFDASCFNGIYVTGDIDDTYLEKLEGARNDSAKSAQIKNDEIIEIHNEP
ncbi:MAG: amidophosphoribosyltransferase, partial [Candidatus Thermoplasmatota archaeon]|nr:amidophosphoribosyltransferase [Candidatus Thermoplasmatota archaeon]